VAADDETKVERAIHFLLAALVNAGKENPFPGGTGNNESAVEMIAPAPNAIA
jgi:hypothetical protein